MENSIFDLYSIIKWVGAYTIEENTTTFRVIAAMDEGNFASEEFQGYSVDNIHPSTPDMTTAFGSGDNVNRTGKSVDRGGNIANGRGYTVNGGKYTMNEGETTVNGDKKKQ